MEGDWERGSASVGLGGIRGRVFGSMAPLVLAWGAIRGRGIGSVAVGGRVNGSVTLLFLAWEAISGIVVGRGAPLG